MTEATCWLKLSLSVRHVSVGLNPNTFMYLQVEQLMKLWLYFIVLPVSTCCHHVICRPAAAWKQVERVSIRACSFTHFLNFPTSKIKSQKVIEVCSVLIQSNQNSRKIKYLVSYRTTNINSMRFYPNKQDYMYRTTLPSVGSKVGKRECVRVHAYVCSCARVCVRVHSPCLCVPDQ